MPPDRENEEEVEAEDEGAGWTPEEEETAPEFMEPVVEVSEGDQALPGESGVRRARDERDARGSTLYRERTVVEKVVEEDRRDPEGRATRADRRAERERRRLDREVERAMRRQDSRIRSTLVYKTFYDLVCNRLGVIVAGFGVAMILFTISYDWLQGQELSLGTRHLTALVISVAVYFTGMGLEGMRVLSSECEGLEARALAAQANGDPRGPARRQETNEHIPMIPDDAVEKLLNGESGEKH
jgi:hypothetical protein